MKKRLMLIGAVVFTILSAFSATAQENPTTNTTPATDPILANMKLLLGDDVLAVVHVNLEKIDVDAVFDNNRKSIKKLFDDLGIPEKQLSRISEVILKSIEVNEDWDKLREFLKPVKETLTQKCNMKEIFLIVQSSSTFPYFVYLAIPKAGEFDLEQFAELCGLSPSDILTHTTNEFTFISSPTNELMFAFPLFTNLGPRTTNPYGKNIFAEKLNAIKKTERPDFLEAYNAVKDYPVRILFAFPQYVKKIVAEIKPAFSKRLLNEYPVLKPLDVAQLVQGLNFKAIGLNLEQGKIKAVTQMESELDTQRVAKQIDSILTVLSEEVLEYLELLKKRDFLYVYETVLLSLYPDQLNKKSFATIKSELTPKLDGNRLTMTCDFDKIKTIFSNSGISLDKVLRLNIDTITNAQKQATCAKNMKNLLLAIHNYYDAYKKIPLAVTVDANGKPLHSWRVMLLPYLENYALYQSIRLNEAWDSEHNKQFHDKMPDMFKCPSNTKGNPKSDTVYCMVVGEKSAGRANGKNLTFGNLTDGLSNTIAIVERQTPVCWMSPEDVTFDDAVKGINKIPNGIGSEHDRSVNVG
ncbi:MAG: DUF1559 domain-containing protein, partial [Planctomycetaceae bacterium]|nr:DUF1559 domain-containing protein [Planctomycetaceae bacterium]